MRRFWRPLFSILPTVSAPISPVERTCVPPHACRSTPSISTSRIRPPIRRRAHRHGPDQLRARVELVGIDPHEADRPVLGDPARDALGDLVLVGRGALEVEVEPAPLRADLTAGDRARHCRAQQVHRAVHAHQAMPARPVDLGDQAGADAGRHTALRQPMRDAPLGPGRVDRPRAPVRRRPAAGRDRPAGRRPGSRRPCDRGRPRHRAGPWPRPHSALRRRLRETAPRSS